MKRIAAAALLACATPALAANWIYVDRGGDGRIVSIDADTVRHIGRFAQVWVQVDLSKVKSVPMRSLKELWKFDCDNATTATQSSIGYRADGTLGPSSSVPDYNLSFEPVAPDTVGESVMRRVCAKTSAP